MPNRKPELELDRTPLRPDSTTVNVCRENKKKKKKKKKKKNGGLRRSATGTRILGNAGPGPDRGKEVPAKEDQSFTGRRVTKLTGSKGADLAEKNFFVGGMRSTNAGGEKPYLAFL